MNKTDQKSIETLKKDINNSINNISIVTTKDIEKIIKLVEKQEEEIKIYKKKIREKK